MRKPKLSPLRSAMLERVRSAIQFWTPPKPGPSVADLARVLEIDPRTVRRYRALIRAEKPARPDRIVRGRKGAPC